MLRVRLELLVLELHEVKRAVEAALETVPEDFGREHVAGVHCEETGERATIQVEQEPDSAGPDWIRFGPGKDKIVLN